MPIDARGNLRRGRRFDREVSFGLLQMKFVIGAGGLFLVSCGEYYFWRSVGRDFGNSTFYFQ